MKKVFLVTLLYLTAIYAVKNELIAQNSEKPKRIDVSAGLFKTYYVGSEKIKDLKHLEKVLRSVNDKKGRPKH